MKKCYRCQQVLPESEYYKDRTKKDGLQSWCTTCRKQYLKQYRNNRIEEIKKYNKKYKQDHNGEIKRYNKIYKREHKKEINEYNKQYIQEHPNEEYKRHKTYRENNRDKVRKKQRRYYLRKHQLYEKFTLREWLQKIEATDGICPTCGRSFSDVYPFCVTLDHTPPVSKAPIGFVYTIEDVTPICGACNSSKNNSF